MSQQQSLWNVDTLRPRPTLGQPSADTYLYQKDRIFPDVRPGFRVVNSSRNTLPTPSYLSAASALRLEPTGYGTSAAFQDLSFRDWKPVIGMSQVLTVPSTRKVQTNEDGVPTKPLHADPGYRPTNPMDRLGYEPPPAPPPQVGWRPNYPQPNPSPSHSTGGTMGGDQPFIPPSNPPPPPPSAPSTSSHAPSTPNSHPPAPPPNGGAIAISSTPQASYTPQSDVSMIESPARTQVSAEPQQPPPPPPPPPHSLKVSIPDEDPIFMQWEEKNYTPPELQPSIGFPSSTDDQKMDTSPVAFVANGLDPSMQERIVTQKGHVYHFEPTRISGSITSILQQPIPQPQAVIPDFLEQTPEQKRSQELAEEQALQARKAQAALHRIVSPSTISTESESLPPTSVILPPASHDRQNPLNDPIENLELINFLLPSPDDSIAPPSGYAPSVVDGTLPSFESIAPPSGYAPSVVDGTLPSYSAQESVAPSSPPIEPPPPLEAPVMQAEVYPLPDGRQFVHIEEKVYSEVDATTSLVRSLRSFIGNWYSFHLSGADPEVRNLISARFEELYQSEQHIPDGWHNENIPYLNGNNVSDGVLNLAPRLAQELSISLQIMRENENDLRFLPYTLFSFIQGTIDSSRELFFDNPSAFSEVLTSLAAALQFITFTPALIGFGDDNAPSIQWIYNIISSIYNASQDMRLVPQAMAEIDQFYNVVQTSIFSIPQQNVQFVTKNVSTLDTSTSKSTSPTRFIEELNENEVIEFLIEEPPSPRERKPKRKTSEEKEKVKMSPSSRPLKMERIERIVPLNMPSNDAESGINTTQAAIESGISPTSLSHSSIGAGRIQNNTSQFSIELETLRSDDSINAEKDIPAPKQPLKSKAITAPSTNDLLRANSRFARLRQTTNTSDNEEEEKQAFDFQNEFSATSSPTYSVRSTTSSTSKRGIELDDLPDVIDNRIVAKPRGTINADALARISQLNSDGLVSFAQVVQSKFRHKFKNKSQQELAAHLEAFSAAISISDLLTNEERQINLTFQSIIVSYNRAAASGNKVEQNRLWSEFVMLAKTVPRVSAILF